MRNLVALGVITLVGVAACGGGGSSPVVSPPIPTPSPTVYTAKLIELGGARTKNPSAYERLAQGYRYTRDASFTSPIITTAPTAPDARGDHEYFSGGGDTEATLVAVVNPAPATPLPLPSITTTVQGTALGTPVADPTPGTSSTSVTATSIGASSAGTYVATYPTAVPAASAPGFQYKRIALGGLATALSQGDHIIPGVSVANDSTVTMQATPAASDAYITCKSCYGPFADPSAATGDPAIIHYPYGAVALVDVSGADFIGILPSQWSSALTSLSLDAIYNHPAGGVATPLVLFKTSAGTVCAMAFTKVNPGDGQPEITGPVKCHGGSPDGF